MSNIGVGDLVQIINDRISRGPNAGQTGDHLGHIGIILRECSVYEVGFDVDGAERSNDGTLKSYGPKALRKINRGNESCNKSCEEVIKDLSGVPA